MGAPGAVVVTWDDGHVRVPAGAGPVTIGRDPSSSVVLTSSSVSRAHALLTADEHGWSFRDRGSAQGSYIDGMRVGEARLGPSTVVTLGRGSGAVAVQLQVEVPASSGPLPLREQLGLETSLDEGTEVAGLAPARATVVGQLPPRATLTVRVAGQPDVVVSDGVGATLGREVGNDVVLAGRSVSRRHGRIEREADAWVYTDLSSSGGSWSNGSRVERLLVSEASSVRLGDPDSGVLVQLLPDGAAGPGVRRPSRRLVDRVPRSALVAATVVLALVVVGTVVAVTRGSSVSTDDLARATVQISYDEGSGSGTVIDARRGLILTNAHVAEPQAAGQALLYDRLQPDVRDNSKQLVVSIAESAGSNAEPRFVADVVAVDGYLDLAVVKILRTLSGATVRPKDLQGLTAVDLGDSDAVTSEDEVRIFGYPGASQSSAPTATRGVVAGVVNDDRLGLDRGFLNVDAEISPGNSGGLAADLEGRIIGVPTLLRADRIGSLRPIALAAPLIAAARADKKYVSPYVTPELDAAAEITDVGLVAADSAGAVTGGCTDPGDTGAVAIGFTYTGFPGGDEHIDLAVELVGADGRLWASSSPPFPQPLGADGCFTATFDGLESGTYDILVGAGPFLEILYADKHAKVTVD
ncbi:FHA domain-containing protein [Cellulomonas sp. URHD0024]|uniref:FHA domain-containing protein n=1 Tax=Cellulomonas sp. URHD0024 TaxID=1302620 RepID=UPI0003F77599|nr:FHA domain-containing protein [Cellulomonas sp. URHD0024]